MTGKGCESGVNNIIISRFWYITSPVLWSGMNLWVDWIHKNCVVKKRVACRLSPNVYIIFGCTWIYAEKMKVNVHICDTWNSQRYETKKKQKRGEVLYLRIKHCDTCCDFYMIFFLHLHFRVSFAFLFFVCLFLSLSTFYIRFTRVILIALLTIYCHVPVVIATVTNSPEVFLLKGLTFASLAHFHFMNFDYYMFFFLFHSVFFLPSFV